MPTIIWTGRWLYYWAYSIYYTFVRILVSATIPRCVGITFYVRFFQNHNVFIYIQKIWLYFCFCSSLWCRTVTCVQMVARYWIVNRECTVRTTMRLLWMLGYLKVWSSMELYGTNIYEICEKTTSKTFTILWNLTFCAFEHKAKRGLEVFWIYG